MQDKNWVIFAMTAVERDMTHLDFIKHGLYLWLVYILHMNQ